MKKKKRAGICILMACVMSFYTNSVSTAAGSAFLVSTIEKPAKAGISIGESFSQAALVKAVKKLEEKQEEERRKAEEAARIAKEKEAAAKKAQEQNAQAVSVSSSDEELLAALIYCEAGGEPYAGQVAVGAVVLNRVRSTSFPNTIREVIYQRGQFGPAITGKLDRVLAGGRTTDSCRRAAAEALAGVSPVGSALYFGDGQNFGTLIGGHWFHS